MKAVLYDKSTGTIAHRAEGAPRSIAQSAYANNMGWLQVPDSQPYEVTHRVDVSAEPPVLVAIGAAP